jgi:hypothetical protein
VSKVKASPFLQVSKLQHSQFSQTRHDATMTLQKADMPDGLFNGKQDGGGLKSDGAREGLGRQQRAQW